MTDQTADDFAELAVVDDPESGSYALLLHGERVGELGYSTSGSRRVITHTGVRERYRGRGFAGFLVSHALDDLRAKGVTATNVCPYVDVFLRRHPDYRDVVGTDPETDYLETDYEE